MYTVFMLDTGQEYNILLLKMQNMQKQSWAYNYQEL